MAILVCLACFILINYLSLTSAGIALFFPRYGHQVITTQTSNEDTKTLWQRIIDLKVVQN